MSKVSIVIPCYNAEKFIDKTIRSVLNQSYKSIEIIIIDDCSKDRTYEILEGFNKKYSFIKIFRNNINRGVSYSRNIGLQNVSEESKFVYFFDADDIMLPQNIEMKVKLLVDTNENVGGVFSPALMIDENDNIISKNLVGDGISGNILNELLLWKQMHAPSLVLFKKRVFDIIGNWNEKLSTAADQELLFRVSKHFEILKVDEPLVLYRVHNNNMSKSLNLFEKEHLEVYKIAKQNGLFCNKKIESKAFTNLYLILAFSYKNNINKFLYYMFKALNTNFFEFVMLIIKRLFQKIKTLFKT